MAIVRVEQEMLPPQTDQASLLKGGWLQNVQASQLGLAVREGLGQLGQWDSSLSAPNQADTSKTHGYVEVLGSTILWTNFDHLQILTLLRGQQCYTGDNASRQGQFIPTWSVSIYDVTSDRRWEEQLLLHTRSQVGSPLPPSYWRAPYSSSAGQDRATWLAAVDSPDQPYFQEYLDVILFGTPSTGTWQYRPIDPEQMEPGHGQVDQTHFGQTGQWPFGGEPAFLSALVPQPGQFEDAFAYLGNDAFPTSPVDWATVQGRTCCAQGREVYFSDIGRPGCIAALNILTVQSDQPIKAIGEVQGNLMIWTDTQTWLYRVPPAYICSGGELTLQNNEVGCFGPASHVKMKGVLVWGGRLGLWSSQGQFDMQPLAPSLEQLFLHGVSSPLTSFYVNAGTTAFQDPQPRTFLNWEELSAFSMGYDGKTDTLFCSVPEQDGCWIWAQGSWAWWSFQSVDNRQGNPVVQASRNLPGTQILSYGGRVFGVHGIDYYPSADAVVFPTGHPQNFSSPPGSYFITELGRGGSSDRSNDVREDNRVVCGVYQDAIPPVAQAFYELGKPVLVPQGYRFPQGTQMVHPTWVFPLYITTAGVADHLDLIFQFDNTRWSPITVGASPRLDILIPPERGGSIAGWGLAVPVVGLAECQVYQAGVPALNGNEIRLRFDGAHGQAIQTWTTAPKLNIQPNDQHRLLWIAFEPNTNALTGDAMSLGVSGILAQQINNATVTTSLLGLTWWSSPMLRSKLAQDEYIQSIDWAIKSGQVIPPERQIGIRTRGCVLELLTHGREITDSLYGQLNFLVGSDWKDWVSQLVDYQDDQDPNLSSQVKELEDDLGITNTLRSRAADLLGNTAPKVLNRILQWGDSATPGAGTYLVDDEQVDSLVVSDSCKGQYISWMAYGHLRGRAERLVVKSFRAIVELSGSTRRWGH